MVWITSLTKILSMKYAILILTLLFMCSFQAEAQKKKKPGKKSYSEFGPSLGISTFFGDLGGADRSGRGFFFDLDVDATKPAFGILYRYNFNKRIALRFQGFYAFVGGDDKFTNYEPRRNRNLSFQSQIIEISAVAELNLAKFEIGTDDRFTPYIFAGVGVFTFDPQGQDADGNWVRLQPLGTEGQNLTRYPDRTPYELTQIVVPYGAGFRYGVTPNWALGLEFAPRMTFTDYIDDVSKTYVRHNQMEAALLADKSGDDVIYTEGAQRGDPTNNDSYFFGGLLSLTYKIGTKKKPYKCPKVFK